MNTPLPIIAGPELDALVGEALGIAPRIIDIVTGDGGKSAVAVAFPNDGPWYCKQDLIEWVADQKFHGRHTDCYLGEWKRYPKFSSSIADAWRVVEKMREMKFGAIIKSIPSRYERVTFSLFDGITEFEANALTIPLAVCLAAMAAVRAQRNAALTGNGRSL